jgi:hypothetical protein
VTRHCRDVIQLLTAEDGECVLILLKCDEMIDLVEVEEPLDRLIPRVLIDQRRLAIFLHRVLTRRYLTTAAAATAAAATHRTMIVA